MRETISTVSSFPVSTVVVELVELRNDSSNCLGEGLPQVFPEPHVPRHLHLDGINLPPIPRSMLPRYVPSAVVFPPLCAENTG